jgi:SAM-dependent methyltransferase
MTCPLCHGADTVLYHRDSRRSYLQCLGCQLVFVPATYHLNSAAEKAEYDQHRNSIDDPGYRRFLGRLATPLIERVNPGSRGLDFGCGPGPALAHMLQEAGLQTALYDLYYYPDTAVLSGCYDFICATEVIEHLAQPQRELGRLWQLLANGGTLAIMTKLVISPERFANWHYIRDPTHIAFYSRATMRWIAARHDARLEILGDDVIFLIK